MFQNATIVLSNGKIICLRRRDYKRFKCWLIEPNFLSRRNQVTSFKELHEDIDLDDCDGEGLATFLRFMMEAP